MKRIASLALICLLPAAAQQPNATQPSAAAQPSAARFEVVTVKQQDRHHSFTGFEYSGGNQIHVGGTLRQLMAWSLGHTTGVADDLLTGLPKSADKQVWDIVGKLPASGEGSPTTVAGHRVLPPASMILEMLRGVLLDQFELKYHTEPRVAPVYVLTVANGKLKLTRAANTEPEACGMDFAAPKPYDNIANVTKCTNTSMAELARHMELGSGGYIDHPVVDETGLTGGWDFAMGWTPKSMLFRPPPPPINTAMGAAPDPMGTGTMFEALPRDLGLKLELQNRTIPFIVVDHVDEKPIVPGAL